MSRRQLVEDVTIEVFEGAPHSFFDRDFAECKPACDLSWELILGSPAVNEMTSAWCLA